MNQAAQAPHKDKFQGSVSAPNRTTLLELVKRIRQLESEKAKTKKAQEALKSQIEAITSFVNG